MPVLSQEILLIVELLNKSFLFIPFFFDFPTLIFPVIGTLIAVTEADIFKYTSLTFLQ